MTTVTFSHPNTELQAEYHGGRTINLVMNGQHVNAVQPMDWLAAEKPPTLEQVAKKALEILAEYHWHDQEENR